MKRFLIVLYLAVVTFSVVYAQSESLSEKVAGMEKFPGYFTFYWDAKLERSGSKSISLTQSFYM